MVNLNYDLASYFWAFGADILLNMPPLRDHTYHKTLLFTSQWNTVIIVLTRNCCCFVVLLLLMMMTD